MSLTQHIRARIIAETYHSWLTNKQKVLDVGCGNAVVSDYLMKRFNLDLVGCDVIDYRKKKIPFRRMSSHAAIPFDDKAFDLVMLNDVLHHVQNPYLENLLSEALRVAKGVLVFEDLPSVLLRTFDRLANLFYAIKMTEASNLKTKNAWEQLFQDRDLRYCAHHVQTPYWYPLEHYAFYIFET